MEPIYLDTSNDKIKVSSQVKRFFKKNQKAFPISCFTARKEGKKGWLDESTVYFFHRLCPNLSQVGNALYISFLDKNQETLGRTTIPPFCSTRRRPFTAISIDKNLIDTTRYDKIS